MTDDTYTKIDSILGSFYDNNMIPHYDDNFAKEIIKIPKDVFEKRLKDVEKYRRVLKKIEKKPKIIQKSVEWHKKRSNMLSASETHNYLKMTKSVLEKKKQKCLQPMFQSSAMEWGCIFERVGREIYSHMNNISVTELGFLVHDQIKYYGASPDGITSTGVLVEIKCPKTRVIDGKIPERYISQMQGQMAVCGLKECDYAEFKFVEITEDEYLKQIEDTSHYFGIVVKGDQSDNYIYSDLLDTVTNSYIKMKEYSGPKIYWKLDNYNIVRTFFDEKEWDNKYTPKLKEFWELVQKDNGESKNRRWLRQMINWFISVF